MYGNLFFSEVTEQFDKIVAGLSRVGNHALLISSNNINFSEEEIGIIFGAFSNLECAVWQGSAMEREVIKQGKTLEPFIEYPNLRKFLLTNNYIELKDDELLFNVSTSWIPKNCYTELASLLKLAHNRDTHFSLIPYEQNLANAWSLIASGFNWRFTLGLYSFTVDMDAHDLPSYDSITVDYTKLTQDIGGLPVFMCFAPDTDVKKLLLILGKEDQLLSAANRLKEFYSTVAEVEFQGWVNRGISLS